MSFEPAPNTWVRFILQVQERETSREVRAKVWADGSTEPGVWMLSCSDLRQAGDPDLPEAGPVGVWAYRNGQKYWDDLEVAPLGRTKF